jgi:hypothetical protein
MLQWGGVAGIGQGGAGYTAVNTKMVEPAAQREQAGFDVAQTVAVSQLRKGHGEVLIPTGEAALPCFSVEARDTSTELAVTKKADELKENSPALAHPSMLLPKPEACFDTSPFKPRQAKIAINPLQRRDFSTPPHTLAGQ